MSKKQKTKKKIYAIVTANKKYWNKEKQQQQNYYLLFVTSSYSRDTLMKKSRFLIKWNKLCGINKKNDWKSIFVFIQKFVISVFVST